ncbi:MAG: 7-cyano-7-deazaguanine synthase [Gemmatimonadota bacterium]|nr:7-cyano-7-deazaguanine synthase [Gemmatimonadota bacterium]
MAKNIKAVGLLSGGLDSTIAAAMLMRQGIEVQGLTFYTGFCVVEHNRRSKTRKKKKPVRNEALQAGAKLEVPVELVDISGPGYLKVLTDPKYGYGSAINPCIDCRIFMFKRAKEYMKEIGAQFIFTGEVLGQRPMSQRTHPMRVIENDSDMEGLLLRPLSAKRLPATVPEKEGWVDREQLGNIQGRSRQEQMRLAREYGIEEYPSPAGGCCFLTDKNFARRIMDFFDHEGKENLTMDDVMLLKIGRHFRLSSDCKVVMGREEGENKFLNNYASGRLKMETMNVTGPTTLIEGRPTEAELKLAAGMTARYAGVSDFSSARVQFWRDDEEGILDTAEVDEGMLDTWRI